MKNVWYLYILECSDSSLYTGVSPNVPERLIRHNSGKGAKYTRGRRPCVLKYIEEHASEHLAKAREYEIKKLKRTQKQELIKAFSKATLNNLMAPKL